MANSIFPTAEIPYLTNTATSEFYGQVKEVIEHEMPLDPGNTIVCNLQKTGGYELAVEVIIKPGEEVGNDQEGPRLLKVHSRGIRGSELGF